MFEPAISNFKSLLAHSHQIKRGKLLLYKAHDELYNHSYVILKISLSNLTSRPHSRMMR